MRTSLMLTTLAVLTATTALARPEPDDVTRPRVMRVVGTRDYVVSKVTTITISRAGETISTTYRDVMEPAMLGSLTMTGVSAFVYPLNSIVEGPPAILRIEDDHVDVTAPVPGDYVLSVFGVAHAHPLTLNGL
jgi:hypothetical protein